MKPEDDKNNVLLKASEQIRGSESEFRVLLLLPLVAGNEAATAHTCMCVRAEVEKI